MAIDPLYGTGSGLLNPLVGEGFFSTNMPLEEIKRRRAVANAIAARGRGFPKTVGEGMTYFGESVADAIGDVMLGKAEKAYAAKREKDFPGAAPATSGEVTPPAVVPAGATPSPAPPAPTGSLASVDPDTWEPASGPASREAIAAVLARRNGGPMPSSAPAPTAGAPPAAADDAGETVFEGNPPSWRSDIRTAPPMIMAQAAPRPGTRAAPPASGLGRVPGPFDPRAPTQLPAEEPMPKEPPEPILPPETPHEVQLKAYQRKYRDDPTAVQNAQQMIDSLKQKRERAWMIEHEKWKIDRADWQKQTDPKYRTELQNLRIKAQQEAEDRAEFPLGSPKEHQAVVKESYDQVKNIPRAQASVSKVKELLASDAGMFTGSPANIQLSLAKWAQAMGAPYNPKVSNTETFRGLIVPILAQLRPAIVGPGAQSLPELKMLQDAAAGNITLDRRSIENILGAIEKQGVLDAVNHQRTVMSNAGRGPRSEAMRQLWSSSFPLPMEKLVPRGAAEALRTEVGKARTPAEQQKLFDEFDEDYATPGLAQRMLGGR